MTPLMNQRSGILMCTLKFKKSHIQSLVEGNDDCEKRKEKKELEWTIKNIE